MLYEKKSVEKKGIKTSGVLRSSNLILVKDKTSDDL